MEIDSDGMRRFMFEGSRLRGVRVHLSQAWQTLRQRHSYPEPVESLLGQSLAAVALLGATIKFDGSLIMQVRGDGPISLLVAQATGERTVRGMASLRGAIDESDLGSLIGSGHLALTIDPGHGNQRYQGIVELTGTQLSATIDHYFATSDQLPTRLWLAADGEHAAGLLLQALPGADSDTDAQSWQHLIALAETVKSDELLSLSSEALLRRLFHAEPVRVFESEAIRFACGCSRERVGGMLRAMPLAELRETAHDEGGLLAVNCDFCNAKYDFDIVDLEALFAIAPEQPPGSVSTH